MAIAPERRAAVLEAFQRALCSETHVLQNRPELLWQQLYNRLQWEEEPLPAVLEPALEERSRAGAGPWLRTSTPFRESSALLSVLEGHSLPVTCLCVAVGCTAGGFLLTTASVWLWLAGAPLFLVAAIRLFTVRGS